MHYEWEHAVAAGTAPAGNVINVPMKTGDILCRAENFQPDAIKIDVEGHEIKVLKGLSETIHSCSPLIFLEVHPERIPEEGDSISFLETFLASWITPHNSIPASRSSFHHFKISDLPSG